MPEPKPIQDFELTGIHSHLWQETTGPWAVVVKWCHDHNRPVPALLNSLIPALAFCLQNYTSADEEGNPTAEINLGTITVKRKQRPPWMKNPRRASPTPKTPNDSTT